MMRLFTYKKCFSYNEQTSFTGGFYFIVFYFMYGFDILVCLLVVSGAILSIYYQKLSGIAALVGGLLSVIIYYGSGYAGILMMAIFFIIGTAATSLQLEWKQKNGLAETGKGKRNTGQVFANAGMAAIVCVIAIIQPSFKNIALILTAACFASATGDTVSSELGNIYGKRFYNTINFKKAVRGINGVISTEGTLLGIAGSSLIAIIYGFCNSWNIYVVIIIIAGILGNFTDSFLGATLEQKNYIGNNTVNFLNTLAAALAAFTLYIIINSL